MVTNCTNCGQELSELNVWLAPEDLGELNYYCPRYDPDMDRCPTYGKNDGYTEAYWTTPGGINARSI